MLGVLALALGGCSDDGDEPLVVPDEPSDGADEAAADLSISVDTPGFGFEEPIPEKHSLAGANRSPEIIWTVEGDDVAELVILVEDPDAPGGDPFVHWMVAGIDPRTTGVGEGEVPEGAVEGANDMGGVGYGGPAPPPGETHAYHFQVVALDEASGLAEGFSRAALEDVLDAHFLVSGETVGLYSG